MEPILLFRKLWDKDMIDRWDDCELTSQHPHGEPPEWIALRDQGAQDINQYPLLTHYGRGMALPSARELYHARCVQAPEAAWAALAPADVLGILEQAGVFAFPGSAEAYWYAGPAVDTDVFVAFYGVELCPGPEATSVLSPVVKKLAKLTRQQFVDQYFAGQAPAQPVHDVEIDHDPDLPGLIEGDDEDHGPMPDLRGRG